MSSRLITPALADFPQFLKKIESTWSLKLRRRFERERFAASEDHAESGQSKPARYILSMFPYPSGRLHLGHVRIYTSGDVLARYSKLISKSERYEADYSHVVHPMGFDSFGLPAENAAKERDLHPAVWTNSNIRTMKRQLDELAIMFDWREATSNPSFYKWTQKIFLDLMRAGLAYKSYAQVNWDPVDKTVLADEQVDEEGRSWRSGALVEKRYYRQWFIKVHAFTNAIYQADDVDPETWLDILAIQRNWIGKPTGWIFYLPVWSSGNKHSDILPVFTREPELFYEQDAKLVVAHNHWLHEVYRDFLVSNPFTNQPMEIVSTDDVDGLPQGTKATLKSDCDSRSNGTDLMREQAILHAKLNGLGGYYTSDKYRDWLISRQRFWGTPIPAMHCGNCGYVGESDEKLPVLLPNVKNLSTKANDKQGCQDNLKVVAPIELLAPSNWLETTCHSCGSKSVRECETFDTLFDSSWYFLRYSAEPTNDRLYDEAKVQPVWCYIGGKEHAAMHLFYARFITHFLHSIGKLNFREPFSSLLVQGVVKSRTYKLDGKYITKSEAEALTSRKGLAIEYEKMSKSKGNGVDPQELLDTYGVDATRFCLLSYANPRSERLWKTSEEEFKEVLIYLRRVVLTVQSYVDIGLSLTSRDSKTRIQIKNLNKEDLKARQLMLKDLRNKCSMDVIYNIELTNQFRQYISNLHVLTRAIRDNVKTSAAYTKEFAEALAALIVMLNPITPHLSEELWFHYSKAVINPLKLDPTSHYKLSLQASDQAWPTPDRDYGRSHCVKPIDQVLV